MAEIRTLTLTSPLIRGDDVKRAQAKLSVAKWLRPSGVDGVYGPESARAAADAHWWLGFGGDLAHANTYGPLIDGLLSDFLAGKPLPLTYAARRKARLKAVQNKTLGEKALAWLRPHVGDTESPAGSNRVEWASLWYLGYGAPWCGCGATRAYVEAGSRAFKRGERYAYVPYIVHDAIHALNGLARTFDPRAGDLVCFDWDGDGEFDHVELVDRPPGTIGVGVGFSTIGCNTSFDDGGDQSNGGACASRQRTVLGGGRTVFVRVMS